MASYSSDWSSGSRRSYLEDDGDIDDEEFLRRTKGSSGYNGPSEINNFSDLEEQRQKILQQMRESNLKSIESTEKSLSSLRHIEESGAVTAETLYQQREQLERTEKRLDDINTTLRFSQKHIQGVKSVFGGLKNLITGGRTGTLPTTSAKNINESTSSSSTNYYEEAIDRNNTQKKMVENSLHPGLRIRGLHDNNEKLDNSNPQEIIDKNLEQMLSSVLRIKDLSHTLGEEIESQNDLIDKVIDKTEKADSSIHKQRKDIQKLLK